MMRLRAILPTLALFGAVASAGPAHAQLRTAQPEERGWIGISFQVDTDRWGRTSAVTITDVLPGSPAHVGGVRPGDRIMAINQLRSPDELSELNERLRLRVGDTVVMQVERAGEPHRLRLRASARPEEVDFGRRVEVTYVGGDQVETWVRSMDSLRIELVRAGGPPVRIRTSTEAGGGVTVLTQTQTVRSVQAPFEFFVFRGETHDSLKREMVELNQLMAELETRLEARERQIRRRTMSADPLHLTQDDEFRSISTRIDDASQRRLRLQGAMASAAWETAGPEYRARASGIGVGSTASPPSAPEAAQFRPLTPYLVGRNRVAGVEVVDLQPELAVYFEVEGGVLVVDVTRGTPADHAGLVPGDVIVRIDRLAVRSVEDLRFGVSGDAERLPLTVIRRGEVRQLVLTR
jgi:membrane-associated protease RseP (regulator of RpoE activity)